jgi:YesN/AraC family two-component response regulator
MITILIVDDEVEVLDRLYEIIDVQKTDEMQILKCLFSHDAKQWMQTQIIDILISDIHMPGLNGLELSKIAKENNPNCRVIFVTGFNNFDYAYHALKEGCDDFILKINSEQEIWNSINKTIQKINKEKEQLENLLKLERLNQLSKPSPNQVIIKDPISVIKAYIWDHLHEEISLNKLANVVYLHPAYLSRIFKQTTQITITEYLIHARIEKAKQLLTNPALKIQDISLAVGIESPVYFGRLFKKETGFTPQEYRQQGFK